jgi:SAM-dependent methyltransferase
MNTPRASLESLAETGILPLEILHPGGLDTTRALLELCGVERGGRVLDVASGTGETASFMADSLGARVVAIDVSARMIQRARAKARARGVGGGIQLVRGDAHRLPLRDAVFDAAISECTLSLLDKRVALAEMARVVRPGGRVGVHEICWREGAPEALRRRLVQLEGERPETLAGWQSLFERAGLRDVHVVDRSDLIPRWMRESRRELGLGGYVRLAGRVLARWGPRGLARVLASERLFGSRHMGYGIIVGTKP